MLSEQLPSKGSGKFRCSPWPPIHVRVNGGGILDDDGDF